MVGFVPAGTHVPPPAPKSNEPAQPTYLVSNAPPAGQSVDENRSLFDILQANKQKKQEEFEEKLKFKNQFRGLEGDEAEFLDSILESERAVEDAKKREIREGLEAYRRQVEEAERSSKLDDSAAVVEEVKVEWTAKKRRRNEKEGAVPGLKVRRVSNKGLKEGKDEEEKKSKDEKKVGTEKSEKSEKKEEEKVETKIEKTTTTAATTATTTTTKTTSIPPPKPAGLASLLGDYDSDDSD